MLKHRIVWTTYGIGTMRIGITHNSKKRAVFGSINKLNTAICKKVCRECFLISIIKTIRGIALFTSRSHLGTGLGELKFFPVSTIEHKLFIDKTTVDFRRPFRLPCTSEMPFSNKPCFVSRFIQY